MSHRVHREVSQLFLGPDHHVRICAIGIAIRSTPDGGDGVLARIQRDWKDWTLRNLAVWTQLNDAIHSPFINRWRVAHHALIGACHNVQENLNFTVRQHSREACRDDGK